MAEKVQATQEFVPVQEVRDGLIVMKDGSIRAVLLCSSLNFALKSQDEQSAILMQFQQFLNSLDFPVQILIQSRALDIRPYVALLEERLKAQTSDLMRIQITEYIQFIKNFTQSANIMAKSFFIVVPYNPPILDIRKSGLPNLFLDRSKRAGESSFEENRSQIEQRVSVVEQGLVRSGIRVALLGTEEVVELLYKMFNPGELEKPMPIGAQQ